MEPGERTRSCRRQPLPDRVLGGHRSVTPPAAKDCILLCWSTRAQFGHTYRMVEDRWGYEYKTCFAWGKPGRGTGYIAIDNCELLLVFSRGQPVWPAPGTKDLALTKTIAEPWESLFPPGVEASRGEYSAGSLRRDD